MRIRRNRVQLGALLARSLAPQRSVERGTACMHSYTRTLYILGMKMQYFPKVFTCATRAPRVGERAVPAVDALRVAQAATEHAPAPATS